MTTFGLVSTLVSIAIFAVWLTLCIRKFGLAPSYSAYNPMWVTPDDRSNYMLTIEGAKRNGVPTVKFLDVVIPVDTAVAMIDAVNLYAMQCVGVTASNKAAINALDTIEAVEAYDFTTGYPEKLNF